MKVTIKTLEDFPEVPDVVGSFGSLDLAKAAAIRKADARHDKSKPCTMCIVDDDGQELARVEVGPPQEVPVEEGTEKPAEEKKSKRKSGKKAKKKKKKKK